MAFKIELAIYSFEFEMEKLLLLQLETGAQIGAWKGNFPSF